VSAAVVRDTAITALGQKAQLVLKGIRRERSAVAEDYGLTLSPVLVLDVYVAGIFPDLQLRVAFLNSPLSTYRGSLCVVIEVDALRPKRR
jgi:hypothetical protein